MLNATINPARRRTNKSPVVNRPQWETSTSLKDVALRAAELCHVGRVAEGCVLLKQIYEREFGGAAKEARDRETSRLQRERPADARDLNLVELGLDLADCGRIEQAMYAAGLLHDDALTAGQLCKWSAADLAEFGIDGGTVRKLRAALATVRLRLRGE